MTVEEIRRDNTALKLTVTDLARIMHICIFKSNLYSVMAYTTTEKFCSKDGKLKDFKTKNVISRDGRNGQSPTKPKSQNKSKAQLLMISVLLHTANAFIFFFFNK
jgi:hypothetical protein